MNKNLLINIGGALAVASLIFGGGMLLIGSPARATKTNTAPEIEPEPEHGAPEKDNEKGKSDEKPKKEDGEKEKEKEPEKEKEKSKAPEKEPDTLNPAEVADALKQFESQYNDFYSRGSFEDARSVAMKASTLTHKDDPAWMRRTADATYLSEILPAQLRAQKALEIYSTLLTSSVPGADKHWAQYRVCLCLRQLGRWEDALQAIDFFLNNYPDSERLPEVRLYRAQAFFALGRRDEAQQEIEKIIKTPASRDVHATALVELAQMNLERSKNEASEVKINNVARAEVIDLGKYPNDPPEPAAPKAAATKADVPEEQWGSIRRAIEKGNIKEAQRLLDPWVDSSSGLTDEQRARISIKYANMVRELAQNNPGEAHK